MALNPGEVIVNRYKIVKKLGEGGFGAVYLAEDLNLRGKQVAIKINLVDPSNPTIYKQAVAQFEQEALMLATLSHPNLPRVTDYQPPVSNKQFFVMDYIPGESIQARITRDGAMDETPALRLIDQVFDALEYLHAQNPPVIHRDIKPANIIITPNGKAFLVDFGISKINQTLSGARAVSPCFSPPEQYGTGTDPRSDVYAVGATLYFILTGTPPVDSMARMVGDNLKAPKVIKSKIPVNVNDAILTAMNLQIDRRFQSAHDFRLAVVTMTGGIQTINIGTMPPVMNELVVNGGIGKRPGEFSTIQQALDSCTGDVKRIVVRGGSFTEYLTITGNVVIRGEDQPVLHSPGDQPAIRIREGSLTIEGVNFNGTSSADCCIEQLQGTVNLKNCQFSHSKVCCIRVKGGEIFLESCMFSDSVLSKRECTGLITFNNAKANINQCLFKDLKSGILTYGSSTIEVSQCKFEVNSDTGASIYGAQLAIFKDCIFEFNKRAGLVDVSDSVTLVIGCNFNTNECGLFTNGKAETKVSKCQFRNNGKGALCMGDSQPVFEDCIFYDKGIFKKDNAKPKRI
jgi:serine/threonine-protein kinase